MVIYFATLYFLHNFAKKLAKITKSRQKNEFHFVLLSINRNFANENRIFRIMKTLDFKPKMVSAVKNYNKKTFVADLMAGIIVGIVALPLAIAFGIASGVSPEKGIITAIVAGLAISLFGGSKVQIGGPTGAFIIIVYGIIQQYGMQGLTIATLMAGVFLILLGVLRLGTIIKYIPYPTLPHRGGIYKRYCRHHLHDAGKRSAGADDGQGTK